jgi:GNAT superfamily N-acetyltransferase
VEHEIIRINTHFQDLIGWIAVIEGITVGHVFMQIQKDSKIKFLDAWVHEDYRRRGIYRSLWDTRWEYVNDVYTNKTIYAWCLPMSLPLLQEKGFTEGDACVYVEKKI